MKVGSKFLFKQGWLCWQHHKFHSTVGTISPLCVSILIYLLLSFCDSLFPPVSLLFTSVFFICPSLFASISISYCYHCWPLWFSHLVFLSGSIRASLCLGWLLGIHCNAYFSSWWALLNIMHSLTEECCTCLLAFVEFEPWSVCVCDVCVQVHVFTVLWVMYCMESERCMTRHFCYDNQQWKTTSRLAPTPDVAFFCHPFLCQAAHYSHWIHSREEEWHVGVKDSD